MGTEVEILLVDDSDSDVELTIHALRQGKIANKIHVAQDGAEALDFLFCRGAYADRSFSQPPRVVLLDLKLPKVDGIGVLQGLKADERTRSIPVVILTSSREQQDLVEGYRLGANAYIQKPVDATEFHQTIQKIGLFWLAVNHPPLPNTFSSGTATQSSAKGAGVP
jgi:two-component system, response regulator